jgi:hypothetical protein
MEQNQQLIPYLITLLKGICFLLLRLAHITTYAVEYAVEEGVS